MKSVLLLILVAVVAIHEIEAKYFSRYFTGYFKCMRRCRSRTRTMKQEIFLLKSKLKKSQSETAKLYARISALEAEKTNCKDNLDIATTEVSDLRIQLNQTTDDLQECLSGPIECPDLETLTSSIQSPVTISSNDENSVEISCQYYTTTAKCIRSGETLEWTGSSFTTTSQLIKHLEDNCRPIIPL